jgi:hypothetical protein
LESGIYFRLPSVSLAGEEDVLTRTKPLSHLRVPPFLIVHVLLNALSGWIFVSSGTVSPIKVKVVPRVNVKGVTIGFDVDIGDGSGFVVGVTVAGRLVTLAKVSK